MLTWMLKWIGVSDTLTQRVEEAQWLWARPTVLWVGLVLLVPAAIYISMRHNRALPYVSMPMRGLLTCCRVGVLALLVLVVAQPYLRLTESVTRKPVVAVLLDESTSMNLPAGTFEDDAMRAVAEATGIHERGDDADSADGSANEGTDEDEPAPLTAEQRKAVNNLTRDELSQRVLREQDGALLADLRERFELRTYRFARHAQQAPLLEADNDNRTTAGSAREDTAIGTALRTVAMDAAGQRLSGIILLSDGRNTAGAPPDEVMRAGSVAGTRGSGTPIWAVPVGSTAAMPDVSVMDVLAPRRVARGDAASIVATVRSHGFADQTVRVTLREGEQTLDEQQLVLRDHERQQVDLTFNADSAGTRLLDVAVEALEEERVTANNAQDVTLRVDEQQWQMLYLEGYPRWDFRFLDHALRRDGGIDTRFVMEAHLLAEHAAQQKESAADNGDDTEEEVDEENQSTDETTLPDLSTLARLPEDAAGFAEYHAIMLGDISPHLLPRRLQEQLARAVREEGVGLVVQAGPEHMPHAFQDGPLAEVLPVLLDPTEGGDTDEDGPGMAAPVYAPYRMEVTAPGSIHPSLRLYDSAAKNRSVWSRMPPFYWAAATTRPAPGATVLARVEAGGTKRPLIAEHFAGRGRVIFIGSDATYRWRRNIGDHLFYRFWGQAMRHVAKAKERRHDDNWIELHPPRAAPGEAIAIELYAVDDEGEPLTDERVTVAVRHEDADQNGTSGMKHVTLERGAEPGHYRGRWHSDTAGTYQVQRLDAGEEVASASVRVAPTGRELLDPTVDRDALGNLAEPTGGGLVELWQLDSLAHRLEGEAVEVTEVHEAELWDNWLTLVVLVGLYCMDVLARRLSGVV